MTQKYRVEAIELSEVGVFDRLRIDFPSIDSPDVDSRKAELHILTGPNGSGKSTLLYAIASLFSATFENWRMGARVHGRTSRIDYKFAGVGYREMVPIQGQQALPIDPIDGPFGTYLGFVGASNDRWMYSTVAPAPIAEYVSFQGNQASRLNMTSTPALGPKFEFAVFAYAGQKTSGSGSLGAIQEISASPFENALSFEHTVRANLLTQWVANKKTEAALARSENDPVSADRYEQSVDRITRFVKDVCDLDVRFKLNRKPLRVSLEIGRKDISFDVLPDGLKSIVGWVADLAIRLEMVPWLDEERDPFEQQIVLLLDEIDIYLHPRWQRRILPALQSLLPNAQIFVSTHSPFVVGSVSDAFVYKLDNAQDGKLYASRPGAGRSYNAILDDVFGVEERFDVETEDLLRQFYRLRDELIIGEGEVPEIGVVAVQLLERSEEVRLIIGREVRQLEKVLGREVVIVPHA